MFKKALVVLSLCFCFGANAVSPKRVALMIVIQTAYGVVVYKISENRTVKAIEESIRRFCPNINKMMILPDSPYIDASIEDSTPVKRKASDFLSVNQVGVKLFVRSLNPCNGLEDAGFERLDRYVL